MKNMLMDAVGGIDLELIEEFIKKDTELKDQSQIIIGRNISRMAVAACAVLIIGAAFSLPKFISPGVNDPSVTPPIIGTDGSDTGSENTNEPTESGGDKEHMRESNLCIGYLFDESYDLNNEYITFTLYYGHIGIEEYKSDRFEIWLVSNGETEKKHYITSISEDNFNTSDYGVEEILVLMDKNGELQELVIPSDIGAPGGTDYMTWWANIIEEYTVYESFKFSHSETVSVPISVFEQAYENNATLSLRIEGNKSEGGMFNFENISISYEVREDKIVIDETYKINIKGSDETIKENEYCKDFKENKG